MPFYLNTVVNINLWLYKNESIFM